MIMKYFIYLLLIICSFEGICQKQLTLNEAINIALKNNLEIELARNEVAIASNNNFIGVAGGLPTINASVSDQQQLQDIKQRTLTTLTGPNAGVREFNNVQGNIFSANATASYVLFNGMRIRATKSRLEALESQNKFLLNAQIQSTISQVMLSYYDIIRQQNYERTIAQSIAVSEEKLKIVENQQKVGMANNADLFQARVDVNNLRQSLISQQLIATQSRTDLFTLLNLPADSTYLITDSIAVDTLLRVESIINTLDKNYELMAADQEIKVNDLLVRETASQRYPSLRLNAGYNYNRTESQGGFFLLNRTNGPFVGAALNIPIYNGNTFSRQEQSARISAKSAAVRKNLIRRNLEGNIIKLNQSYKAALAQLQTGTENYKIAKELLDLVVQRFELKQATIVDVKLAQQSFENAGYLLTNLSFAAKSAEIELKRIGNQLGY